MSAFKRLNSTRKSKKDKDYGLVKGGLTPTFPRKHSPLEVPSGEYRDDEWTIQNGQHSEASSTCRPLMTQTALQVSLPRWEITPGLLGICNHGNTCFMNTVLQCLSNTDLFSDYFVRKKFKELLNVKGIAKRLVGTPKGEVTDSLSNLLESIWSGEYTPEVSSQFKNVVSKYNTQYKGSSQHDAQEFLLWLLDRVNEELHQSQKKKSRESTLKLKREKATENATESSPEMVLSLSNGFEIYNRFQALYQSSLTCPNCGEHSNTYETYLCLSLPVPQKSLRPVFITIVYLDDNPKQLRIALQMNVLDTIKDLREKLANELKVPPKRLVLCQIYDDGFRNTYGDDQLLSDIHESENVYVFETHPLSEVSKVQASLEQELIQILLVHVEKFSSSKCYRFCMPEIIRIHRDINYSTLQKYILRSMGLAISEDVVEHSVTLDPKHPMFDIRVIDSGVSDTYLPTEVDMPLYTQAIETAISTYSEEFGPPHVKFVIEWDPRLKEKIVLNDEDMFEEHQSVHKVRLSQQQPSQVSLDECLRLFTKEEMLGEGDAWNCPGCSKEQKGTIKKLGLWSTPDVLVIHLKRFRHVGSKRNKLDILVNYPVIDLDMGTHVMRGQEGGSDNHPISDMYDLYAVSNHTGNMNGGHYTAFCKNPIDQRWYEFDDTHVRPLDQRDIVTRRAYLLFYQRKKLTNSTVDALHSKTHWVYSVYGPPLEMSYRGSPDMDHRRGEDRSKYSRDYASDYNGESPRSSAAVRHKREVNGHGNEDYYDTLRVDLNSPRREEKDILVDINSPRQSTRHSAGAGTSPRKQLFDNGPQKSLPAETGKKAFEKTRVTVAEQILQSKASMSDHVDGVRLEPQFTEYGGDLRVNLHHSSSVDSSRYSRTSSSGTGSAPSSPQYDTDKPGKIGTHSSSNSSARSDNRPLLGAVLNNARDLHSGGIVNSSTSNVKLKVHSNQIHSEDESFRSIRKDVNKTDEVFNKVQNQKQTNISPSGVSSHQSHVFSPPTLGRKSPPPNVQSGRGFWSTPQPQRKQYSLHEATSPNRPAMDRQFSFPSHTRPVSQYDMKGLVIEAQRAFEDQPRSLPNNVTSVTDKPPLPKSEKPPLPKSGQGSSRSGQGKVNGYEHSRPVPPRPGSARHSNRVPASSEYRPLSAKEPPSSLSSEQQAYDIEASRLSHSFDDGKDRGRLSDRLNDNYGRGTRSRSERPGSYNQTAYNDFDDQYYLSQPIEPSNFDRSPKYATMRPARVDTHSHTDHYLESVQRHQQYQPVSNDTTKMHQPRSRVPISYNPNRYQDSSSILFPRYQPHLHTANYLTKLAMQEKEYINKKMKNQYLKESSV